MPPLPLIDRQSPGPLLGLSISYPSPGAVERIGADWDWLWIDTQHGDLDFREAVNLVRVSTIIGRPGLVRVPAHDPAWIGRMLDAGAAGVIIPQVESLAEARAMVKAAKFPPLGDRSFGGRRVIDFLGRNYYKTANADTVLILQLESTAAVALAPEMAAIDGVDGLFLGPDDLSIREGREADTPKTKENLGPQTRLVAESCRRHGKLSVCVGAAEGLMEMARDYGYRLVAGGSDVGFLASGSKAASAKLRGYFKRT